MIPTFLGATLLVFTILQMAPGGPLDKTIQQLQSGGQSSGSIEGGASGNSNIGGGLIPKRALKELKRFYGFDKPLLQRYLIWLGVWKREIKHKTLIFNFDEFEIKKNMGKRRYANIKRNGSNLEVYDKDGISAAHKTLPLNSLVKVTNLENGKSVTLRINDRGPYIKGRILDCSYGAAKKLDFVEQGTTEVKIEVIKWSDNAYKK